MNSRTTLAILSLMVTVLLAPCPTVLADEPGGSSVDAAELYRTAWRKHADLYDIIRADDLSLTADSVDWRPDANQLQHLLAARPFVDALIEASRAGSPEWGYHDREAMSEWFTELAVLRQSARLLVADARRCMIDGDGPAAAERLGAVIRLAHQVNAAGDIISTFTAGAIFQHAAPHAEHLLAQADVQARDEVKRALAEALTVLPERRPFGFADALRGERELALQGLAEAWRVGSEAAQSSMPAVLRSSERAAAGVALMLESERTAVYFDELIDAWTAPRAAKHIRSIAWRQRVGEFGSYVGELALDPVRLMELEQEWGERVDRIRSLVQDQD